MAAKQRDDVYRLLTGSGRLCSWDGAVFMRRVPSGHRRARIEHQSRDIETEFAARAWQPLDAPSESRWLGANEQKKRARPPIRETGLSNKRPRR